MERVAVYARVSTDLQERQETIETQLMVVRDACAARGYEVVRELRDEGVSGTVPLDERPGGAALLAFLREERGVTRTVVYDLSRVGRDELVTLLAEKSLKALGAPITSVTEPLPDDDLSPFGVMARGTTRTMNAVYRATVRQNTMYGRQRVVRAGTHYLASRTPYGYVRRGERDAKGRLVRAWLEVEPEQADVVRRVFALTVEGLGVRAIATRLAAEGLAVLSWRTVAKLVHARRYAGEGSYAGLPMTCPPLVSVVTWEAANAALQRRQVVRPRPSVEPWLLGGLVWCGRCGSKFSVRRQASGRRTYCCRRRRERGPAAGHEGVRWSWPADELEALVRRHVTRLLTDPEHLLREASVYDERADTAGAEREDDVVRLRQRLDGLDEERRRAQRLARKGLLTDVELTEQLGEVARERRTAEADLANLLRAPVDAARLRNLAALLRDAATTFSEAVGALGPQGEWEAEPGNAAWAGLVRQLVDKVVVNDDGSVTVEGALTCPSSR